MMQASMIELVVRLTSEARLAASESIEECRETIETVHKTESEVGVRIPLPASVLPPSTLEEGETMLPEIIGADYFTALEAAEKSAAARRAVLEATRNTLKRVVAFREKAVQENAAAAKAARVAHETAVREANKTCYTEMEDATRLPPARVPALIGIGLAALAALPSLWLLTPAAQPTLKPFLQGEAEARAAGGVGVLAVWGLVTILFVSLYHRVLEGRRSAAIARARRAAEERCQATVDHADAAQSSRLAALNEERRRLEDQRQSADTALRLVNRKLA